MADFRSGKGESLSPYRSLSLSLCECVCVCVDRRQQCSFADQRPPAKLWELQKTAIFSGQLGSPSNESTAIAARRNPKRQF